MRSLLIIAASACLLQRMQEPADETLFLVGMQQAAQARSQQESQLDVVLQAPANEAGRPQ